ncbi:DUF6212 domain-containing protein, partial [Neoroseomonas soli]|nr:hypothetical protein [Neoroseomonas soli]
MPDRALPGLLVRAPTEDLPALFDGRPVIVVESRLPDTVALHGAGARICRAHLSPEGVTLRFGPPRSREAAPVTLQHPPPAVLALVAQTPLVLGRLAGWWRDGGLEPPVLIAAEGGLAALPELMTAALAAAGAAARRVCELEDRCAALRAEAEHLRASVAAMLNTVAGRSPPGMETRLDLAADPAGSTLRLAAGAAPLVVEPGMPTPGIARLSLHLPEAAGAALSVRLIGAESGRVLCAWRVPPAALPAGWLHLETPEPLLGRPESLLIGLRAEGEAGEVALSAAAEAPEEPALSIAVLPPGGRLVRPLHMDWAHWHDDAAVAAPRQAPAQMLAEARVAGPGELDAGSGAMRCLALPEGWEATRVDFGPLPEGCAALRCDLRLGAGVAEARLMVGGAAATPWRVLPEQEARPFILPVTDGAPAVAVELRGVGAAAVDLFQPVLFPATRPPEPAPEAAVAA